MAMLRSLLLLLVVASIQAGPVMAEWKVAAVEWAAEKLVTKTLGKIKGMEEFVKGVKTGFKVYKYGRKAEDQWHQYFGGHTAPGFFVDTVVITDGTGGVANQQKRVVVTADITALAPVRVGLCGSGSSPVVRRVLPQQSSIEMRAGGRVVGTVKPLTTIKIEACPSGAWDWTAVLGLGRGGVLSRSFPRFSYQVRTDGGTAVSFPPQAATGAGTTQLVPTPISYPTNQYYVSITGMQISGQLRQIPTVAYLSTTEPYTILDSAMYRRVRDAIVGQMQVLNRAAKPYMTSVAGPYGVVRQRLCYLTVLGMPASPLVPPVGIVFANNVVMRLTGANVWSMEESTSMCLAILPTTGFPGEIPVIGTRLQSGRTMTIDLTAAGGPGTLTFD